MVGLVVVVVVVVVAAVVVVAVEQTLDWDRLTSIVGRKVVAVGLSLRHYYS